MRTVIALASAAAVNVASAATRKYVSRVPTKKNINGAMKNSESQPISTYRVTRRITPTLFGAGVISAGSLSILKSMNPQPSAPKIQLSNSAEFREGYANSVQVRVSLWDFYLMFGRISQSSPDAVSIQNFQGIFLSPQQAKALSNVLTQNVQQYEAAFGEIKLEPRSGGPVIQ